MVLSAVGLVALSPLLALIALAIRLDSPGPAVFHQKRFGKDRKLFEIYKFRTMRVDAPRDVPTNDLRGSRGYITRVGRILRMTSLDELPQLWNLSLIHIYFPVRERTGEDIVPAVREMLSRRLGGEVMRLEAEERMSEEMLTLLMRQFGLERERRYRVTGPLDLNRMLMNLYALVKRPGLKYPPAQPVEVAPLMGQDVYKRQVQRGVHAPGAEAVGDGPQAQRREGMADGKTKQGHGCGQHAERRHPARAQPLGEPVTLQAGDHRADGDAVSYTHLALPTEPCDHVLTTEFTIP